MLTEKCDYFETQNSVREGHHFVTHLFQRCLALVRGCSIVLGNGQNSEFGAKCVHKIPKRGLNTDCAGNVPVRHFLNFITVSEVHFLKSKN